MNHHTPGHHAYLSWHRSRHAAAGTIHVDAWKLLDRDERAAWEQCAKDAARYAERAPGGEP